MEQKLKYILYISVLTKSKKEYRFYCSSFNEKYNFSNCKKCAHIFIDKSICDGLSKQYVENKQKYEKLFGDWVNEPVKFNLAIIEEL